MLQKILLGDLMFRPKHGNNAAVVLGLISSISSRLSFRSMKERSPQQRHQRPKERSGLPFQQKTLHTTSKRKKWLEQRRKNENIKVVSLDAIGGAEFLLDRFGGSLGLIGCLKVQI